MTDRQLLEKILDELTDVKNEVKFVKNGLGTVKEEVSTVKEEVSSVKEEVSSVKEEVSSIANRVSSIDNRVGSIENEVKWIKTQQQEDHLILKALKHNSEVNKAEHDKMVNEMAYMEGHLKNIDENLNAVKEIIGKHEVDIRVLKNRPV